MDSAKTNQLKYLTPDQILKNPENPRLFFRTDELETLALSIDRHGIQVPLSVYSDADEYYLIDGERRWRCAKKLNIQKIPAFIQEKPSNLENLLLMYNIHALREQWDYFTIASKLTRVIALFEIERDKTPTETELSLETGLSRSQIRRCNLLIGLPEKYKEQLLEELERPKNQQKLSEDFFIEMEKALKTVLIRFPEFAGDIDKVRDVLVNKYRSGIISNITDFRHLSKIATSIENFDRERDAVIESLGDIFSDNNTDIEDVYSRDFEFQYDEKSALIEIERLMNYVQHVMDSSQYSLFDDSFLLKLEMLSSQIKDLLERAR